MKYFGVNLCMISAQEIPGKLTFPILHSQRATNYKTIQRVFPSTIYKILKYSEEQIKKNPHMQQNEQDSHFTVISSVLIADL